MHCFDLRAFLQCTENQLQRDRAAWRCPICGIKLAEDEVYVDAYWATILQTDPNAEQVDIAR